METGKKRVGRPTKSPEGERVSLGLRVTADIKRRLDAAAEASGRSQSQEAEFRLERSFDRQGLLEEVLFLAYPQAIAKGLVGAHRADVLHFTQKNKDELKDLLCRWVDALPARGAKR